MPRAAESYENLLYQIRPAFGGNIIATIVNPGPCRPQMATVREGVMRKEELAKDPGASGVVKRVDVARSTLQDARPRRDASSTAHIEERGHRHQGTPR